MSKQHTPGPWKVRNSREVFCGNKRICSANAASREPLNMKDDLDVSSANARLIAASPLLYEALKRMASIIDKMGDMPDGFIHPSPWQTLKCEEALTQARAAIKAVEESK